MPMFKDVIETELEFDQSATEAIVDDYTAAVPPVKKVESAAFLNPLVINKGAEAIMFDKYIKDWKPYQINQRDRYNTWRLCYWHDHTANSA